MPLGNMGGWTFVILVIIILLLFGATRLPKLAKSLGESMRIFRGEMKSMNADDSKAGTENGTAQRASDAGTAPNSASDTSDRKPTDSASDGPDTAAR
ncbi:MAG: Sec-independent protein translocase subunit TatA [Gulosibacter sp.]|uniref:Sec-independent protein translocase subunit TatA n=1 Tax=Gulosibacter sp. TaxID=2817531 RepID=UPI003F935A8A